MTVPAPRIPRIAMACLIATVTLGAVAAGLTYPLLSFILERQRIAPGLVGLSAAMMPLGFIASAYVTPALSRRLGAARLAVTGAISAALTLAAIALLQDVWAWMPLRFLLGFFTKPSYVISETWLIAITPASRRGRIMGVYSAIVSGGFALGPVLLGLVGTEGWPAFVIAIVALLLCGLVLHAVVPRLPDLPPDGAVTTVGGFFSLAPLLLFAVFVAAAFEQTLISLFAAYGAALGSSENRVAWLIACFIAGDAMLQIPLGHAADRFGSARVMLFCVLASLAGCLLLSPGFDSWLVWPLIFLWGGVSFGIYTMTLIQLGERFTGRVLIAGNAAFALVWGIGGIAGSPATGMVMQWAGHHGLPASLGLLCCVLSACLLARRRRT